MASFVTALAFSSVIFFTLISSTSSRILSDAIHPHNF